MRLLIYLKSILNKITKTKNIFITIFATFHFEIPEIPQNQGGLTGVQPPPHLKFRGVETPPTPPPSCLASLPPRI